MKPVFLINGLVLFEPDKRQLCPLAGYPERVVILHGPVSECLLHLLEHNGEVLTQRYLFAAVWEKQGAIVTTNALYQTIASIRKALKTAGLADNVVQTVPKEGFKSVAHLQTGTLDTFIVPVVKLPPPVENLPSSQTEDNAPRRRIFTTKIAYGVAGLLFLASCSVLYLQLNGARNGFEGYQPIGKLGGCEVYSSWHDKIKSQRIFSALNQRYPIQCNEGDVAYMTLNRYQNGTSVIVCNSPPGNEGTQCDSIMYREQYHESE